MLLPRSALVTSRNSRPSVDRTADQRISSSKITPRRSRNPAPPCARQRNWTPNRSSGNVNSREILPPAAGTFARASSVQASPHTTSQMAEASNASAAGATSNPTRYRPARSCQYLLAAESQARRQQSPRTDPHGDRIFIHGAHRTRWRLFVRIGSSDFLHTPPRAWTSPYPRHRADTLSGSRAES